ncbi:Calcium/proton exchanger [Sodiomyces alkalinus F11]|uniref:Vacuolar calcium ion transporter n=1 Tax=Sodiomyces alkalinus (strain CBS 110278 / VKM F-3762 / F11) TaxID=1314773 RepID=A0A3N2PL84_SODAK|nr:Calcium/proton exchanger [Sodiomyces alkalinus F11]ROT35288.1 Calcium/proton exchanger [Sodiomyces alkalinus F11]
MTANVAFRKSLQRAATGRIGCSHGNSFGVTDDRTPLIGRPNGGTDYSQQQQGFLRKVLGASDTPGLDSSNVAVRCLAWSWHMTKATLYSNYVNVLLVFVPLGLVAGAAGWSPASIFALNFIAIIPLAAVLSFATEQLSARLGEALGGLLNATFGNAVELIVSIVALRNGQIQVVQSSLLGSIISNLLLVMGFCFLLGGIVHMKDCHGNGTEQCFALTTGQVTSTLMTLSSASMIIPTALYLALDGMDEEDKLASVLQLSRGTSIVLLVLYLAYMWFQLETHKNLFICPVAAAASSPAGPNGVAAHEEEQDEEEEAIMSPWAAGAILVITTLLVSFCANYLVESIDPLVEDFNITKTFIGFILIPIVGNAAEHATACVVAVKDKMDLAIGVAMGSSVQIALLVTPFLVLVGWAMDQPMSLRFQTFEVIVFALSVLVVSYTVRDGKTNYLEGAMLLGLYIILAIAAASMTN